MNQQQKPHYDMAHVAVSLVSVSAPRSRIRVPPSSSRGGSLRGYHRHARVDWQTARSVVHGCDRDCSFRPRRCVVVTAASTHGISKQSGDRPGCPVCRPRPVCDPYATVRDQVYWRCGNCKATFLDPSRRLDLEKEKQRYSLHENDAANQGYRKFLGTLTEPLLLRLASQSDEDEDTVVSTTDNDNISTSCIGKHSGQVGTQSQRGSSKKQLKGLDYGCGPGPVLGMMLREQGLDVVDWDPIFKADPTAIALDVTYDFLTCTEVAEHFYDPRSEFNTFDRLVRDGGLIAILTSFQPDNEKTFQKWHYIRDPTHVVFYGKETVEVLARERGWVDLTFPGKNVAIMRKPEL